MFDEINNGNFNFHQICKVSIKIHQANVGKFLLEKKKIKVLCDHITEQGIQNGNSTMLSQK